MTTGSEYQSTTCICVIDLFLFTSAVEASVHGSNVHCSDKTIEAAEALLHMESPTCLRDARTPGMSIVQINVWQCYVLCTK